MPHSFIPRLKPFQYSVRNGWALLAETQLLWIQEIQMQTSIRVSFEPPDALRPCAKVWLLKEGVDLEPAHEKLEELLRRAEEISLGICDVCGRPTHKRLIRQVRCHDHAQSLAQVLPAMVEPLPDLDTIRAELLRCARKCIDMALMGPPESAAELLAEHPDLLASARTRLRHGDEFDTWPSRAEGIVARADSLIAQKAVEAVLTGNLSTRKRAVL